MSFVSQALRDLITAHQATKLLPHTLKNSMHGRCLCEQIHFEVAGTDFKLYQCHCSLCRRQSGSSSNAATIAANRNFRWVRGEELIASWVKPSGFRSDFCSVCGSPVPNPLRGLPYVWVPAGLLDGGGQLEIIAHLHMASKAPWDSSLPQGSCHEALPDWPGFIAALQPTNA